MNNNVTYFIVLILIVLGLTPLISQCDFRRADINSTDFTDDDRDDLAELII